MGKHTQPEDSISTVQYVRSADGVAVGDIFETSGMWTVVKEVYLVGGVARCNVIQLPKWRGGEAFRFPGLPPKHLFATLKPVTVSPNETSRRNWFKRFFGFGTGL